jgi:type IV pilus assembly protein PilB
VSIPLRFDRPARRGAASSKQPAADPTTEADAEAPDTELPDTNLTDTEKVSVTELPQRLGSERRRMGDLLVAHGRLTESQLREALAQQQSGGGPRRRLGQVVVDQGFLSESQLAEALAELLGLEMIDLDTTPIDVEVGRLLSRLVSERNRLVVVARTDNGLLVAASDPTNVVGLDDVRVYTGAHSITVAVTTESQIRRCIARLWSPTGEGDELATMVDDVALPAGELGPDVDMGLDLEYDVDQAPTVRLVNGILADAVRAGASDIHIEPQQQSLRIRYRIDGMLRDITQVARTAAPALISRVKIISGLDIAERRVPQDGRARLIADTLAIDARVSTLPGVHGEKVVIRLLSSGESVAPLAKIGLDEHQLETLLAGTTAPQGLVLITGPTGSGKTNTLYSVLSQVATPDKNVVTLEDPVEIQLIGITQVQINERTGLTFSKGLRSVLRQDPDVVLVGEVRDAETAELALQASLTGHLVLTTLQTNDSVAALTRLVDMGIEPFLVASSLTMVVAQRLVRRPCPNCSAPYVPSARILALLGLTEADLADATPRRGQGCTDCGGSGYHGRVGIFEVLPVTTAIRSVLLRTPNEAALATAARAAGMLTLRGSGLAKARRGETTFEEVLRVTQVDLASGRKCSACDRAVGDDMVVCPWCATTIDQGHCSGCARPLEPGWKICPWCRTPSAVSAGAPAGSASRLPRVLIVGSDPALQSLAAAADGVVEATVVADADAAIDAVWEVDYDGVVVGELAEQGGVELVRMLRAEPHTAALPLMLLVDEDSKLAPGEARLAGADEVVDSGTDRPELMRQVLALTERSPYLAT